MAKTLAEEWALGEIVKLKNTVEWHVKSCVDFEREITQLKAALTQAHEQGWNECKETAVKTCAQVHSYQDKGVSACIQAISRLRIEEK